MEALQVHNWARSPGGLEMVIEGDRQLLLGAGWEVEQFFLSNSQIDEISRLRAGAKAIWNLAAARALQNVLDESRPDIVHVHTPFPLLSPVVFRVCARNRIPTVATVNAFRYSCVQGQLYRDGQVCELCLGKRVKLAGIRYRCYHDSLGATSAMTASLAVHRLLGTFHHDVDVWIAASEFLGGKLVAEGFPATKIAVKPNAVPDAGYQPEATGNNALFMGRLLPSKGIGALLTAWELLDDPPPLTILGDGPLRQYVEQASRRNPHITFKEWADQATVTEEVRSARFLVLPSEWYEAGLPIVGIQAFAAGTPIIASDVGNFSEMIEPGVTGFLFRSGDAESLAEAVRTAWEVPGTSQLRSSARRYYLDRFSQEENLRTLLSIYDRAITQRRARPSAKRAA
jgi:glycosyltransferase involved in cell wall biosynthesis